MLNKLARYFFYAFVLSLPLRIDFLFYDFGVDYLGQLDYRVWFVYLSEFFLWLSAFFFLLRFLFFSGVKLRIQPFDYVLLLMFIAFIFAIRGGIAIKFIIHYLEFVFIYFVASRNLLKFEMVWRCFLFSVVLVAFLAFAQFILQASVGLTVLGEPSLSATQVGVAKFSFSGLSLLRPYGTFAHPNLLAAYCLFALVIAAYLRKWQLLIFLFLLLLVTFSRSAYLALLISALYCFRFVDLKFRKYLFFAGILLIAFVLFRVLQFDESYSERLALMNASFSMIKAHPFGVGVGNFVNYLADFSYFKLWPWELQPVHSHLLLFWVEMGVLGLLSFVLYFWKLFALAAGKKTLYLIFPLIILCLGLFDHYFYSFYQGVMLFALINASVFADIR